MKSLKAVFCMLLMACLIFSLFGCSFGGGISVDKDGNLKVKGEDGEVEIGKAKWDSSKMYGLDAPKATLNSYIGSNESAAYTFSEMKESDAQTYINKIKDAGFTYSTVIIGDYSYTGVDKDGKTIHFSYDKESGDGMITAGQGEKPSEEDKGEASVIGGSNKKWETEKMGGLPDPGATVISYWSMNGSTCYTFEKIDNYLDYVEKIKANGFIVDESVMEINDVYMYAASNSNGNRVSLTASADSGSITFEKGE